MLYSFDSFVDFKSLLSICRKKEFIEKNRKKVIKNCSISLFNYTFNDKIQMIISKHF